MIRESGGHVRKVLVDGGTALQAAIKNVSKSQVNDQWYEHEPLIVRICARAHMRTYVHNLCACAHVRICAHTYMHHY